MCQHLRLTIHHKARRRTSSHLLLLVFGAVIDKVRMAWFERRSSSTAILSWEQRSSCLMTASLALTLALRLVVNVTVPLCVVPRNVGAAAAVLPARNWTKLNFSVIYNNKDERTSKRQWREVRNNTQTWTPSAVEFSSESFVSSRPPRTPVKVANSSDFAMLRGNSGWTSSTSGVLQDGIYWGDTVENTLPKGFSEAEVQSWRRFTRTTPIVKMEDGCGRMQNRLLIFEDGTTSCCRYRQNTDQIQGELFSFLLGRLLGLRNLAPSALAVVRLRDPLWQQVQSRMTLALWTEDKPVVITRFVPSLELAHIPKPLRGPNRRLHPPDVEVDDKSAQLVELAQWSDLVVFDYLTANLDRVVNNLYNQQWNKGMMDAPAHNLAKDPLTGLLMFLDNESGLLHGYRLLRKYESYHRILLDQLCVFRKPTIDALRRLHISGDIGHRLEAAFQDGEPDAADILPGLPIHNVNVLRERIARVMAQVELCEVRYGVRL